MPWVVRRQHGKYCVYKEGPDGNPTGDSRGCHDSVQKARRQQRALYVHAGESMTSAAKRRSKRTPRY